MPVRNDRPAPDILTDGRGVRSNPENCSGVPEASREEITELAADHGVIDTDIPVVIITAIVNFVVRGTVSDDVIYNLFCVAEVGFLT
ncbi:hypothetical protein [Natrinema gelatinilyticum]|uniref:hypothetical protein n=1 Tax=Natrinema gelatinilyticum TaxID=2961571 RepID=UPI0020C2D2CF|nr:hypothetical protein [Natrinema gelatinilyticum]